MEALSTATGRRTVLLGRNVALARVERVVDAEDWRNDKRDAWLRILRFLAEGIDPNDGVVADLTLAQIAAATGTSTRTVSRLAAWATQVGLLVVVEPWAAPPFERRAAGSAPMYAFIA